jgi:hypothetical protein
MLGRRAPTVITQNKSPKRRKKGGVAGDKTLSKVVGNALSKIFPLGLAEYERYILLKLLMCMKIC